MSAFTSITLSLKSLAAFRLGEFGLDFGEKELFGGEVWSQAFAVLTDVTRSD
jgi:hypothetical protein